MPHTNKSTCDVGRKTRELRRQDGQDVLVRRGSEVHLSEVLVAEECWRSVGIRADSTSGENGEAVASLDVLTSGDLEGGTSSDTSQVQRFRDTGNRHKHLERRLVDVFEHDPATGTNGLGESALHPLERTRFRRARNVCADERLDVDRGVGKGNREDAAGGKLGGVEGRTEVLDDMRLTG